MSEIWGSGQTSKNIAGGVDIEIGDAIPFHTKAQSTLPDASCTNTINITKVRIPSGSGGFEGKRSLYTVALDFGGGEIRTHDALRHGGFRNRCTRPLCDASFLHTLAFSTSYFKIKDVPNSTGLRSYSNILQNLSIARPREVSACRTIVPS